MKAADGAAVGKGAGQALQVLGRAGLGGLCGIGFVWLLTVLYSPSRVIVLGFGRQFQTLARDFPEAVLGLLLGMGIALLWQAVRKP
jgi:hypothetical protein